MYVSVSLVLNLEIRQEKYTFLTIKKHDLTKNRYLRRFVVYLGCDTNTTIDCIYFNAPRIVDGCHICHESISFGADHGVGFMRISL